MSVGLICTLFFNRITYVDTQVIFMLIKSSGPHRSPEKQCIEKKKVLYVEKKNLKVTKVITKNYIVNGSSLEKRNEEFP